MATMDRDTFIPLGTSIAKLLLIASGQGALATAVGEGAGLLAKFRRTLEIGGIRAVFAEKIADDAAKQLLREHQGISEADWHVAARQAASLIDQLSEKERLAAGYNWEELRRTLLDLGGTDLRSDLADESARQAFDWLLEVACQRIADCFTEKEALASILESVEEVRSGIQRLADRPAGASQTRAVVADHMEVVRDLAPDPLEDRERELVELKSFVDGSQDTWYAMEAGMVSGKTALMSSFTLNPPDGAHIVSFFTRRIGGDGNDWRSFSFVAGAQLAEILGDEYTERASDPASQDTEFRQLLRRASMACRSDKNPRPLVLLIDGVDEDSYYERPDAAAAKSILSLLPRRLPEGVKVMTASRPNPRPPEDIVCDSPRRVVSLEASPIAQKKINQKDIENFLNSKYGVDIGAFLAACGGSLTVDELRQLIARRRRLDAVPSGDIKACVERSPGRILMRVNVGFGDRPIPSYTLGHDAVLRAVLRELSPDLFGGDEGVGDEAWWAESRERVLLPYYQDIRGWVKKCADRGWGCNTPNYLLSESCFELMFGDDKCDDSSIKIVLDRNRYNEVWRRSERKSLVLRMIDRESFKVVGESRAEIPEGVMTFLYGVAELRELVVRASTYVPGLPKLYVLYFNLTPEAVLDMVLSIDSPKSRLNALVETMKAAVECGRVRVFLPFLPVVLESLASCRDFNDKVLRLLVDVLVSIGSAVNDSEVNGFESFDLERWVNEIQVYVHRGEGFLSLSSSFNGADEVNEGSRVIAPFYHAEEVAERIEDSQVRARALAKVAQALAGAGHAEEALVTAERIKDSQVRARALAKVAQALAGAGHAEEALVTAERIEDSQVRAWTLAEMAQALVLVGNAEEALATAERIEQPWQRARTLAEMAQALVRVGYAEEALVTAERIKDSRERARALAEMAEALVRVGYAEEALATAERIKDSRERARALARVAKALARAGETDRARQVAENAASTAERIEQPWQRARTLAEVAQALARAGETDRARQVAENAASTAERIEQPWQRARTLAEMAEALAGVGYAEEALATAERIEDSQVRAWTLAEMAQALARAGETDRARQVAENAASTAERIEQPWQRARTLAEVAQALAGVGYAEEALAAAERIEDSQVRARALARVAKALARAGETDRARQVAENAASTAERIEDSQERAWTLAEVAQALTWAGETDRARQVAENAASTAERIEDSQERARALARVAKALTGAGHAEEALATAERIKDSRERARALAKVAQALTGAGHAEEALATAERIKDSQVRARALAKVAQALTGAGHAEEALATAERIKEPWQRAWTLAEVAEALVRVGYAEEALATAERIEDSQVRAQTLGKVAQALAQAGSIDGALKIVSVMNDPTSRSRALSSAIKALVCKGSSDDAVEAMRAELGWVRGVAERRDAAGCYATLAEACADASDLVDSESTIRGQWLGLARSALACSWLYGASVWGHFGILMRVAPELAVQLVDERILADPEHGTVPESDPDLGYEGPGGDTGSYR